MLVNKSKVRELLASAMHPEINYDLLKLGMIKINSVSEVINLTLLLPFKGVPIKEQLINIIKESLKGFKVKIDIGLMSNKEKEYFMRLAREGWIV